MNHPDPNFTLNYNQYSGPAGAASAFLTTIRKSRVIFPNEALINSRTRIKTLELYEFGSIEIEKRGIVGAFHQLTVMSAGCSTSLVLEDGDRPIFHFPVLQTGSFKLECAFWDGLNIHISTATDAPPHLTLNWRVVK